MRAALINDSLFDNNCDVRAINTHFLRFILNTRYFWYPCLILSFHLPFRRYSSHYGPLLSVPPATPFSNHTISKRFCPQIVLVTLTGATIFSRQSFNDFFTTLISFASMNFFLFIDIKRIEICCVLSEFFFFFFWQKTMKYKKKYQRKNTRGYYYFFQ